MGPCGAGGDNGPGQLGLGDEEERLVPTQVGTAVDWAKVSTGSTHTCGVRTDHTLWCWGNNYTGQLGLGDEEDRLVPTQVGIRPQLGKSDDRFHSHLRRAHRSVSVVLGVQRVR